MALLRKKERKRLQRLFWPNQCHVLDFTDEGFEQFLAVFDLQGVYRDGTMAERLHRLLWQESNRVTAGVIEALIALGRERKILKSKEEIRLAGSIVHQLRYRRDYCSFRESPHTWIEDEYYRPERPEDFLHDHYARMSADIHAACARQSIPVDRNQRLDALLAAYLASPEATNEMLSPLTVQIARTSITNLQLACELLNDGLLEMTGREMNFIRDQSNNAFELLVRRHIDIDIVDEDVPF